MSRLEGFTAFDAAALCFFLAAATGYHLLVERLAVGRQTLNRQMDLRRVAWFEQALRRDVRIIDTQIISSLQNGSAFFASTSLIALGGALAMLQSADRVIEIVADLPLSAHTSRTMWELKIFGLAAIFAYALITFAWAYRLFNYVAILFGGLPPAALGDTPAAQRAAREVGAMSVSAGRHFNRGQRAFFFAVAYLGWLLGPAALVATTCGILAMMLHRQFRSDSRRALLDTPPAP